MLNRAFDYVVLLVMLLIGMLGIYFTWDATHISENASFRVYQQYKPAADSEYTEGYDKLTEINPDVLGWITLYDTDIDYPLVQGETNSEYLYRNARGESSYTGSIFLDCHNSRDFSDFNTIIYGHHISGGAMFSDLDKFEEEDYFNTHKYGSLYYAGSDHIIEIFSFLNDVSGYDEQIYSVGIETEEEQEKYIERLEVDALYNRELDVTSEDNIVLLSTCSRNMTNGRYILAAVITEKTQVDLYEDENKSDGTSLMDTDFKLRLKSFVSVVPLWYWLFIILLLLMLIFLVGKLRHIKRHSRCHFTPKKTGD